MSDLVSHVVAMSTKQEFLSALEDLGAPEEILTVMRLYVPLVERVWIQHFTYLDLPAVLAPLAQSPGYYGALCWGRMLYSVGRHEYDEKTGTVVRDPLPYEREEIREYILGLLALDDPFVAVSVSLSFRVGVVVGWLSGLSTSQREDARATLVLVAALAAPLLVSQSSAVDVPQRASLGTPGRSQKVLRSGKSKKLSRRSKTGRK